MKRWLNKRRDRAVKRTQEWVRERVYALCRYSILEVGCGDGFLLQRHVGRVHGIECDRSLAQRASSRGYIVSQYDMNEPWPYGNEEFGIVILSQSIEHAHNTTLVLSEAYRVMRDGGTLLLATENLASWPNLLALALGWTPFSLCNSCGVTRGNPLSMHHGETAEGQGDLTVSGRLGHNRVLTYRQCVELVAWAGFVDIKARTLGFGWGRRGHFMTLEARKDTKAQAGCTMAARSERKHHER